MPEIEDQATRIAVNPMTILDRLTAQNVDPEKLGRVIDLVRDWNRDQSIKAFNRSKNACDAEMPDVIEDAKNTQTGGTYALLETVQRKSKPIYTKHGFSLSWSEGELVGDLRTVVMTVRHVDGHVDTVIGHYPIDGEGPKGGRTMNQLQGTVSAHTYAQRDMARLYFNIILAGLDADGNAFQPLIDEKQVEVLNNLFEDCRTAGNEVDQVKFQGWISTFQKPIENVGGIEKRWFGKVKEFLESKRKGLTKVKA
jgi:hypothetical protein